MIFFDEQNPNKYRALKKQFIPQILKDNIGEEYDFKRFGRRDGSYILPDELCKLNIPINVLSYGIGSDINGVSFESDINKLLPKSNLYMYDGSIEKPPIDLKGEFHSEYVTKENFGDHVAAMYDYKNSINILKMDIEGHEYSVLSEENLELIGNYFEYVCIEVHSLIDEIPEGWELEPQLLETKGTDKVEFYKNINKRLDLWHMHGNNHSPRYVDFPDSLELTYINKRIVTGRENYQGFFPIDGLDFPNFEGRNDYILDWWL